MLTEVLSFERIDDDGTQAVDVLVSASGNDDASAELFLPPGLDALPLPGDNAILQPSTGKGRFATGLFLDTRNAAKSAPGEHRAYARDESGEVVAEIYQKNDGTIVIKANGTVTIDAPLVKLSDAAALDAASVGSLAVVTIPPLVTALGPVFPASLPSPPGSPPTIQGVAQIINGRPGTQV